MTPAELREAVARALYDKMEGPVANQDFARQCRQWDLAQSLAEAAIAVVLEAAAGVATSFLVGDPKNGIPLRNPMAHEIADRIRALKGTTDD